RRQPQPLEIVVQPEQRQRRTGHVEAGAELADLGCDHYGTSLLEKGVHGAVDDEELFVFHRAQSVEDRHHPSARQANSVGDFIEELLDEDASEVGSAGHIDLFDARLSVYSEPDGHPALWHGEQWLGGTWQGATAECHTERTGTCVGVTCGVFDPIEVVSGLGCGACDLEDDEIARDSAPLVGLFLRGAPDVVGDPDGSAVDTCLSQTILRLPEM